MSFRAVVSAGLSLLLLSACAQEKRNPKNIKTGGESTQCLSDTPQKIEKYLFGELNREKTEEFWDCAAKAIRTFKSYVRGREEKVYRATELRKFLETYFLGDVRISDPLLEELMRIKQLVLGGEIKTITHKELDDTIGVIDEFRVLTVELQPHMGVVTYPWNQAKAPRPSVSEFDQASRHLEQAAWELSRILGRQRQDYAFSHLQVLLSEVASLVSGGKSGSRVEYLPRVVPVLARLKSLLVGESIQKIGANEWPRFFFVASRFYGIWARYANFVAPNDWRSGLGLDQLSVLVNLSFNLLEESLIVRKNPSVQSQEIHALVKELSGVTSFPQGWTEVLLIKAWDLMVDKIFATPSLKEQSGYLTLEKIAILREEFSRWHETQTYIVDELSENKVKLMSRIPSVVTDSPVEELQRLLTTSPWPLVNDQWGRLILNKNPEPVYDLANLSLLNLEKTLVRLLIRSYAQDEERRDKLVGLTLPELEAAFFDFKDFAVEFGLLAPENNSFHNRIYQEGNLFLPHSDGDELISFEEGVEYLHYALAGVNAASLIWNEVAPTCGENDGAVSGECFRSLYAKNFTAFYEHMPMMATYGGTLATQEFNQFLNSLLLTIGSTQDLVTRSDVVEMSVLLQYIEVFMMRFDVNHSQTINLSESLELAYPIYARTLSQLLGGDSDEDIRSFYTYLFRFGQPPDPARDPLAELRFRHWRAFPERWSYEAPRSRLAEILATLSEFSR